MTDGAPRYRRAATLALEWEGERTLLADCATGARAAIAPALSLLLSGLGSWRSQGELAAAGIHADAELLEQLHAHGLLERWADDRDEPGQGFAWHPFDLDALLQGPPPAAPACAGPPPPAFLPSGGARVELPPPPPLPGTFADVLAARRSVRRGAPEPLALAELSGLLHHAARAEAVERDPRLGEYVRRPTPSAGARSPLELHVVAVRVEGLDAGAYRYDARAHALVRGRSGADDCAALVAHARAATGDASRGDPPLVLVLSAVVARTCWKYGRLGHRLIQQDLGCLHQTLYLVATALGLAGCAIGAVPLRDTAARLGLDALAEPPLAGFLLAGRSARRRRPCR